MKVALPVISLSAVWLLLGSACYPARAQSNYLHLDPAEIRSRTVHKPQRLSLDSYLKRRARAAHKKIAKVRSTGAPKPVSRISDVPIAKPPVRNFAQILPWGAAVYVADRQPADRIAETYRALEWPKLSRPEKAATKFQFPWMLAFVGVLFWTACVAITLWPTKPNKVRTIRRYRSEPIFLPKLEMSQNVFYPQFGKPRRKIA